MWLPVWHALVHGAGIDYGLPYGHWGWYSFWSGIAGSFLVGVSVWLSGWFSRHTCHTWWCPRAGHFDFTDKRTGISHKLCRRCHPDHPGYRLDRSHIARIHASNRAHQAQATKGET